MLGVCACTYRWVDEYMSIGGEWKGGMPGKKEYNRKRGKEREFESKKSAQAAAAAGRQFDGKCGLVALVVR